MNVEKRNEKMINRNKRLNKKAPVSCVKTKNKFSDRNGKDYTEEEIMYRNEKWCKRKLVQKYLETTRKIKLTRKETRQHDSVVLRLMKIYFKVSLQREREREREGRKEGVGH